MHGNTVLVGIIIVFIGLVLWLSPLLLLWIIGILFNVQVEYNFTHWLAALLFQFMLTGSSLINRK